MSDEPITLREYTIDLPTGEARVLLSDEDAEQRGLKPVEGKELRGNNTCV